MKFTKFLRILFFSEVFGWLLLLLITAIMLLQGRLEGISQKIFRNFPSLFLMSLVGGIDSRTPTLLKKSFH